MGGPLGWRRSSERSFLDLYNLTERKGVMVADMWDRSTREGAWKLSFHKPLNDWELDEDQIFLSF